MTERIEVELRSPGAVEADAGDAKLVQGPPGERGPAGYVYTPSVSAGGIISWTNDGGLSNPSPVNIRGPQGAKGAKGDTGERGPAGAVFTPGVDAQGNLSWSNDGGLQNPQSVNIRGPKGDTGPAGPSGPKGDTGAGLEILGQYPTLEALDAAVASPEIGDNYYVGEAAPYDIYTWTVTAGTPQWLCGGKLQGAPGEAGGYYAPSVSADGVLSWTASGEDMPAAPSANIRGPKGDKGDKGDAGQAGAQGPQAEAGPAGQYGAQGPAGSDATINGVNALTITAGENIELEQSGSTLTISAAGANALVVQITGSDAAGFSASHSSAEIAAAWQAGTPMYAIWDDWAMHPVQMLPETGEYYFGLSDYGTVGQIGVLDNGDGTDYVFASTETLRASRIDFDPDGTQLTSTDVQDAIVELCERLGLT